MHPERRFFDPTAVKDLLGRIGNEAHRALRYSPRLAAHALIGIFAGAMLLGLTFVLEEANQATPDINRQYSKEAISEGNRRTLDYPIPHIAGGAILFPVLIPVLRRTAPWLDRKLEELKDW